MAPPRLRPLRLLSVALRGNASRAPGCALADAMHIHAPGRDAQPALAGAVFGLPGVVGKPPLAVDQAALPKLPQQLFRGLPGRHAHVDGLWGCALLGGGEALID